MRAGRPSQEKVFPAAPEATLSQQQAEDIVKAAASRIATQKVRQECTSEILRDAQMRVEKVGVAREVPPSNSNAQQTDTIGLQVHRLRTVREVTKTHGRDSDSILEDVSKLGDSSREVLNIADTAADRFAVSLESPIVPRSELGGINPEGKHVHQVAVMTYTPMTEGFESIGRSQVRITTAKLSQRERQLSEEKIEPQARRKANETRISTVAQGDRDDEMIEQLLKELEELNEPHDWSADDEAMTDALLQELEIEIGNRNKDESNADVEKSETIVNYWGASDVSAENISEEDRASCSEAKNEAEGKCGPKSAHLTGRFEQPNSLIPVEVTQQHPTPCHRRRLWVSHRKRGRWKHERQQVRLRGLCWPTHRKHGRWKSGKRDGGNACGRDDAAMYVKLHPPNT